MKNRLIVFLFSIVTGIFFMSGGYGFWQDQLVINTTLLVKPPVALEEKTDKSETEAETEAATEAATETKINSNRSVEQPSIDSIENEENVAKEVDSTNSIVE